MNEWWDKIESYVNTKSLFFQRTLIGNKRQLLSYSAAVNIAKNILKTKKTLKSRKKETNFYSLLLQFRRKIEKNRRGLKYQNL